MGICHEPPLGVPKGCHNRSPPESTGGRPISRRTWLLRIKTGAVLRRRRSCRRIAGARATRISQPMTATGRLPAASSNSKMFVTIALPGHAKDHRILDLFGRSLEVEDPAT